MGDKTRRGHQRRAAMGSRTAKIQVLRDRVRAGELDQMDLEFAAYLRQPAAAICLGVDRQHPQDIISWAAGLARWGKPTMVRVLLPLAEECYASLAHWSWSRPYQVIIEAATSWVNHHDPVDIQRVVTATGVLRTSQACRYGDTALQETVITALVDCVSGTDELPPATFDRKVIGQYVSDPTTTPSWMGCTLGIYTAAWIADRSGRLKDIVHGELPSRAATNHVISVIRHKVLDQQWLQC